jgi:hypothetical protein
MLPLDYATGIPEYYIPEGTLVNISAADIGNLYIYLSRTSFLSKTNIPQITNLSQWNPETLNLFKPEGIYRVSNNPFVVQGPFYVKILTTTWTTTSQNLFSIVPQTQPQVTTQTNTATVNPNTAVVIPSTVTGDVEVVLEQSQDGVTWTQCLPGTYNASTVKRFFRLRAVEK